MSYTTDKGFCDFALSNYDDLDEMQTAIDSFEDISYSTSFIVDPKYDINLMDSIYGVVDEIIGFDPDEVIQFKNVEFPDEVYERAGIQKGAPLYCTFNDLCNNSYRNDTYSGGIETEEGLLDNNDVAFCLFKTPDPGPESERGKEESHWFNNPSVVVPIYIEEEELAKDIAIAIAKYFYQYLNENFNYEELEDEYKRDWEAELENRRSIERSFHLG